MRKSGYKPGMSLESDNSLFVFRHFVCILRFNCLFLYLASDKMSVQLQLLVTHFYSTEIPHRTSNSESGLGRRVFAVHFPNTQIKFLPGPPTPASLPPQLCSLLYLSRSKVPFHCVKTQKLPAEFFPVSQRKTCFQPSVYPPLKSFSWLFAASQNMKKFFKIYCFRVSEGLFSYSRNISTLPCCFLKPA